MMGAVQPSLHEYLDDSAARIASACTACGKCVTVCPVVPFIDLGTQTPEGVTGAVRDLLAEDPALHQGQATQAALTWAGACNGCGDCIPACPEAVNPRRMLTLALTRTASIREETPQLFRKMARAIKLMAGMQLVPDELARLLAPRKPRQVPVVFYTGCNAIRTPHLLFNTMAVLDALAIDYEVMGGPGSCCGIIHAKWEGEIETGGRVAESTLRQFAGATPEQVLNWCPSCHLHLTESLAEFHAASFDINHVTDFIRDRLDVLRAKFIRPIPKRVIVHAHTGYRHIGENVTALVEAIPEIEVIETIYESGYTCGGSGCNRAPGLQAIEHKHLLDRVAQTGADILVTLYHGCHGMFVGSERQGRHQVLNFTDLLVEALGERPHPDRNKHYQLQDDLEATLEEAEPYLRANGLNYSNEWLRTWLKDVFASREFKGGLECFAVPKPGAAEASARAPRNQ